MYHVCNIIDVYVKYILINCTISIFILFHFIYYFCFRDTSRNATLIQIEIKIWLIGLLNLNNT